MNLFYSILRVIAWLPIRILFPIKVIGKENMPLEKRVITVSNHYKALDIAFIAVYVPGYRRIIAKKEVAQNAFMKWFVNSIGVITVDRGKADLTAIRKVLRALNDGQSVTMFPEGTRNKTGGEDMQSIKAGAAMFAIKGSAKIVPIMMLHKQRVFRRNYMYVGEAFSVAEFAKDRVGGIDKATELIGEKMAAAREYLVEYVENGLGRKIKKDRKEAKKREKTYKSSAKRGEKLLKKAMKDITR